MEYVYDFVVLLAWTGVCALLVSGLERVLEAFGYRPSPVREVSPPPTPE